MKVQDAQYLRGEGGGEEGRDEGEEGVSEDPKVESGAADSQVFYVPYSVRYFFFPAEQNINRNKLGKKV